MNPAVRWMRRTPRFLGTKLYVTWVVVAAAARGSRARQKFHYNEIKYSPSVSPGGFQKGPRTEGCPSIILHNKMIYSISQASLHCNLNADVLS